MCGSYQSLIGYACCHQPQDMTGQSLLHHACRVRHAALTVHNRNSLNAAHMGCAQQIVALSGCLATVMPLSGPVTKSWRLKLMRHSRSGHMCRCCPLCTPLLSDSGKPLPAGHFRQATRAAGPPDPCMLLPVPPWRSPSYLLIADVASILDSLLKCPSGIRMPDGSC